MAQHLVGGQALVEGVMMRCGENWSAAARLTDGSIVTTQAVATPTFPRLARIPVLRGINALADSLIVGLRSMSWSRRQQTESATATAGEHIVVGLVVAIVVAAFLWVPILAAAPVVERAGSLLGTAVEGLVRLGLFVLYLVMISRLPGIRRTLEYHGAEHMVVSAHEHDTPMTIDQIRRFDVRHPRCGTDFFFLIFAVSIVVFALVGELPLGWLALSRVLLGPLVVGASYEVLRWAGVRHDSRVGRLLAAPGLGLQRFTTRQPDDAQIEVAVAALEALRLQPQAQPQPVG